MEIDPLERIYGRPEIAATGLVFNIAQVAVMQRAADELNLTEEAKRFIVVLDPDAGFAPNGTRLPDDQVRVRLDGKWLDNKDASQFWDRVDEICAEIE